MYPEMTSYEQLVRDFRWEVPAHYNFAVDVIDRWAQDPNRLAMHWVNEKDEQRRITFRDFSEGSNRAANVFQGLGLTRGDGVLTIMHRIPQWWEAALGLMRMGAVTIPGTPLLSEKDIAFRINAADISAVITDPATAEKVDRVAKDCPSLRVKIVVDGEMDGWVPYDRAVAAASDNYAGIVTASTDPMMLYFTSGTVGNPKMVLHTHSSYPIGHIVTGKYWINTKEGDLHWNLSDLGWAKAAWSNLFGPWNTGTALFTLDARGRFDAKQTLQVLQDFDITSFCAPPTAYRMLVLENLGSYSLKNLTSCIGAGEPLNPEVISTWQSGTGLTIRDGYGQTETVLLCGNFPGMEVKPGSMGKPSPGFSVAIIDEDGHEVGPGEEGDIAVRTRPNRPVGLFQEYWRNEEAMASSFQGNWYLTGDRGVHDDQGYIWFVGRGDDVIISAGYRIGPFEVESALIEHAAVAEAAVVASPDPVRGSIVKAFVILAPGYEGSDALAAEIQEHVRSVTAPYKYPRAVEFVTTLPKTVSGKIRRVELRQEESRREQP